MKRWTAVHMLTWSLGVACLPAAVNAASVPATVDTTLSFLGEGKGAFTPSSVDFTNRLLIHNGTKHKLVRAKYIFESEAKPGTGLVQPSKDLPEDKSVTLRKDIFGGSGTLTYSADFSGVEHHAGDAKDVSAKLHIGASEFVAVAPARSTPTSDATGRGGSAAPVSGGEKPLNRIDFSSAPATLAAAVPAPSANPADVGFFPVGAVSVSDASDDDKEMSALLATPRPEHHKVVFGLDEEGRWVGWNPNPLDDSDQIEIFWRQRKGSARYELWVKGELLRTAILRAPNAEVAKATSEVPAGPTRSVVPPSGYQVATFHIGPFTSERVAIRIKVSAPGAEPVVYERELLVHKTFNYTIRMGAFAADQTNQSFDVVPNATAGTAIRRKEEGGKVAPAAVLTFFTSPGGENLIDFSQATINPMVGVGFDDPGKNWYFGLSTSIHAGFDLAAGVNIREISQLTGGFKEGAAAAAGVPLPVEDRWHAKPFVGVTINTDIFTSAFSSIFKPGKSGAAN